MLPARINKQSGKKDAGKRSPGHRKWVRGHACCACGSTTAIECAHVRVGTDGGVGLKPSDRWCISLCKRCHVNQHMMGEESFERNCLSGPGAMKKLAEEFFRYSPHRGKLEQ